MKETQQIAGRVSGDRASNYGRMGPRLAEIRKWQRVPPTSIVAGDSSSQPRLRCALASPAGLARRLKVRLTRQMQRVPIDRFAQVESSDLAQIVEQRAHGIDVSSGFALQE